MSKRDELHNESVGEKGALAAAALAGILEGVKMYNVYKKDKKNEIKQKIADVDRQITMYERKWFPSLYQEEINALKRRRVELENELKQI